MNKKISLKLRFTMLLLLVLSAPLPAQKATEQEALTVANNWIDLIIRQYRRWGGHPEAEVVLIDEFKRRERILGYYCQVAPQGFIIVSRYKNLAPIKAYSDSSNLDPFVDVGLTDLIKSKMERIQQNIEQVTGMDIQNIKATQFEKVLEINYRPIWDAFVEKNFDSSVYQTQDDYQIQSANYQPGQVLLETSWHQRPPYNDDCPSDGCSWPGYGFFNSNTRVGCVATAGAQIMRYWNWPPQGYNESPYGDPYDWPNMHHRYVYNGAGWFNDETGTAVTTAAIRAVAELNYEIAHAVRMRFGCASSAANTNDMEGVFEDKFIYNDECDVKHRNDYSKDDWFNLLKTEFNQNRPVQYRVIDHSIVSDGWQESADLKQYHMNYGWDNSYNAWYTLDALHLGGEDEEYIVREIYPEWAFGPIIDGFYINFGGTWYIDQDASGSFANFSPGIDFQFLKSGLTITGTGGGAGVDISMSNTTDHDPIRFFLHGDPSSLTRIKITEGTIRLTNGGQLTIHEYK